MSLGRAKALGLITAAAASLGAAAAAYGDALPYRPGSSLPPAVSSPPMAAGAPFTPLVRSLIRQLEPDSPPTPAELMNADAILHGPATVPLISPGSTCLTIGSNAAPIGTHPAISPLCWSDAQGINVESGSQVRQTTAPPIRIAMSSSWDPRLLNAWGQVEGREGRWLGVNGIYAPQADLLRIPDWGRNLTIFGEDPFQDGTLAAAEVNGIQGRGLLAQIKHFAFYNGQFQANDARVQDQAAHELYLPPYEYGTSGSGVLPHPGQAASMMCSYARFEIQPAPETSGTPAQFSPAGGALACDHPIKNLVAHVQWGWPGFIASDYDFAMDSTVQAMRSGTDQEMPSSTFFGSPLVAAVETGAVPLATFNLALARILYQEQRFHLLGHPDGNSNYLSPSHPITKSSPYALPPRMKAQDGAVTERASEEGAVLLKNAGGALPLTRADLHRGVLVVGESAEYMPADPGPEQADGYVDRDAISPLEQLRQLAGHGVTFLPYMPGAAPTAGDGWPVPPEALSTDGRARHRGLLRTGGRGRSRVDPMLDFTSVSGRGELSFGRTYTWTGYIRVPSPDDYTFHFQFSVPDYTMAQPSGNAPGNLTPPACTGPGVPAFSLATSAGAGQSMKAQALAESPSTLAGIQTDPTMSGYTERGLANCILQAGTLSAGLHQIRIRWTAPASFARDRFHLREPGSHRPSFRFAYSRAEADHRVALASARRAGKVIVFADCTCVSENTLISGVVNTLDAGPTQLIEEMARANGHTVVVTNVNVATLMPWLSRVRAVLQTWYPGSEGGTATARLLLGRANPGGHLTSTWPRASADTIFGHSETRPLYPGERPGTHPERLSGNGPFVDWTEGIFVGYRYFDRESMQPMFPFGWGLSYTRFRLSALSVRRSGRGADVSFTVTNSGPVAGAIVPQVYLGPAPRVPAGVQQVVRALAGFDRVSLPPQRSAHVTIHIGPGRDRNGYGNRRAFQYWSTAAQAWRTATGRRRLWVGFADGRGQLPLSGSVLEG